MTACKETRRRAETSTYRHGMILVIYNSMNIHVNIASKHVCLKN